MNKSMRDQVEYQQASKITKKFDISITTLRRWNDQGILNFTNTNMMEITNMILTNTMEIY